jgi:hypothetical protein
METTAELNRWSKAIMAPHHMDINAQEASLLIHGWLEADASGISGYR